MLLSTWKLAYEKNMRYQISMQENQISRVFSSFLLLVFEKFCGTKIENVSASFDKPDSCYQPLTMTAPQCFFFPILV